MGSNSLGDIVSDILNSSVWFVIYSILVIIIAAYFATTSTAFKIDGIQPIFVGMFGLITAIAIFLYASTRDRASVHYARMIQYGQIIFILTLVFVLSLFSYQNRIFGVDALQETLKWLATFSVLFFLATIIESTMELLGQYLQTDYRSVAALASVLSFILLAQQPGFRKNILLLSAIPIGVILAGAFFYGKYISKKKIRQAKK